MAIYNRAITRNAAAIIIVIIVVIAGVGVGLYSTMTPSIPATSTASVSTSAGGNYLHDTLTIDEPYPPSYDMNIISFTEGLSGHDYIYSIYQSLLTLNGTLLYTTGDHQVLPMLATDWSVSSDATVYTLNLRHDVIFSKGLHGGGDPFNAYQVWGEWYATYYLTGYSPYFLNNYPLFDMSNVHFDQSTLALMTQSGLINPTPELLKIMMDTTWPIYVTGPYQIVLHVAKPFAFMPEVLTAYDAEMYDVQYVLNNGGFGSPGAINTEFNRDPVPGTGPYMFDPSKFAVGSYYTTVQNPDYWGRSLTAADIQANPYLDPGHVKTVIVQSRLDDVVRYADLSSGAAQIVPIYTQNWPLVQANLDKYAYFVMPDSSMAMLFIPMNTMRYPTNITSFRQAIVHAVNMSEVNQKAFFGEMVPMVGPEYPGVKDWYNLGNFPPYTYNLTLAKEDLAKSGVDVTKLSPLEFRMVSGVPSQLAAAQIIQADLGQIGIPVNVEVLPNSEYCCVPWISGQGGFSNSAAHANEEEHMTFSGAPDWAPTVVTPADIWLIIVNDKTSFGNMANYANPIVQKCVDAWTTTADETYLKGVCSAAQAQIYEDAPILWIGSTKLAFPGGSLVWKKSLINGFLLDPCYTGASILPIWNTVTYTS